MSKSCVIVPLMAFAQIAYINSVLAHISTPLSAGLFQRAVIQSPTGGILQPIQVQATATYPPFDLLHYAIIY